MILKAFYACATLVALYLLVLIAAHTGRAPGPNGVMIAAPSVCTHASHFCPYTQWWRP